MIPISLSALLSGFTLGASLIIAIGAQNAFVLRQGLKRHHVFVTACICTLCDAILITLGVAGFGTIVTSIPLLALIATWGGAAFLLIYGLRSFRSALHSASLEVDATQPPPPSIQATALTILALSLLNPHVYLDTVVLVGSIGAHYPLEQRSSFAIGAMSASFCWFFGLAYGAAWLTPLFRKPLAWRILDCIVGVVMWGIAGSLIWSALVH
ncbi:LysE/ArgO family amino acid transporter [Tengunoibacter tsumagoiensis]|uniref:Amino acid transporter n=1 Tax=Tengunoibacter tsumagoiensis TaxID=2014871 RepID=A0A402A9W1_9CHLR|nr:LysE/ArgO family amino acid transporter [Tengunoibacter tsumagoiensis]GCE15878.1 amino acid transporter [Tengunoibacter tsumagoiensis]